MIRRLALLACGAWAAGIVLAEPLQVGGFALAALIALGMLATRQVAVPEQVKSVAWAGLAWVAWGALTPALARWSGATPAWPRGSRAVQVLEPLGALALPVLDVLALPLGMLTVAVAAGWTASFALAVYQHFVRFPFDFPASWRIPSERVRENFAPEGAPPRFGAGGLLFHRLRFAHAATALLGPALAATTGRLPTLARGVALAFALVLPACAYLGFARAALGASLGVVGLAALLLARGWARRGALALLVLVPLVALSSEGWRRRMGIAAANVLDGERRLAMTAGARMFLAHPVTGVGFGNHKFHAELMAEELHMPRHILGDAHNVWLTTAAETGVVGVLLLAAFHGLLARALWRGHRRGAWLASGALLSLAGYHVLGLVHYLPFHTSVSLSFQFAWGLGLAAAVRADKSDAAAQPAAP